MNYQHRSKSIINTDKHTDTRTHKANQIITRTKSTPIVIPCTQKLVQTSYKHNQPESQALCKQKQRRKENEKQNGLWEILQLEPMRLADKR